MGGPVNIDFLYYEECPSHDDALERLKKVIGDLGIQADISVTKVESEEQAQKLKFIGSPTIRIEGRDIDPPTADAYYGLTCRAFRLESGRISPLPSEKMIRKALGSAGSD
jgi:hypothetical protein